MSANTLLLCVKLGFFLIDAGDGLSSKGLVAVDGDGATISLRGETGALLVVFASPLLTSFSNASRDPNQKSVTC
jgi:hypothetical protein